MNPLILIVLYVVLVVLLAIGFGAGWPNKGQGAIAVILFTIIGYVIFNHYK